jgi:hypothetical protein
MGPGMTDLQGRGRDVPSHFDMQLDGVCGVVKEAALGPRLTLLTGATICLLR